MAANRKLLAEIQQVLKKVEEGVQLFDEIWEKVYAAEQQSLKEKYEADLKKEIKKLQRLRDQIKTWIGSNDIKDKSQLLDARKTIEGKMEQFKICEKDTKTKAYSKEGLAREAKLDPKDMRKEEVKAWIGDCLDQLNDLINTVEVEKEKILGSRGKSKNKDQVEKCDNRIGKHRWHYAKLEQIVRMLDNEDLDADQVDETIKDSLEYYLETAGDDDGALGVEHEFDIYEDLQLESEPAAEIVGNVIGSTSTGSISKPEVRIGIDGAAKADSVDSESAKEGKRSALSPLIGSTVVASSSVLSIAGIGSGSKSANKGSGPPSLVATVSIPATVSVSSAAKGSTRSLSKEFKDSGESVSSNSTAVEKPTAVPPLASPRSNSQQLQGSLPVEGQSSSRETLAESAQIDDAASSTSQSLPSTKPALSSIVLMRQEDAVSSGVPISWASAAAVPAVTNPLVSPAENPTVLCDKTIEKTAHENEPQDQPLPIGSDNSQAALSVKSGHLSGSVAAVATLSPTDMRQPTSSNERTAIESPQQVMGGAQRVAPAKANSLSPELLAVANLLKSSLVHSPESAEAETVSSYSPRNLYSNTHVTFPSTPLFTAQEDSAVLFEKLPMDTLFLAFYYQQGSFQQFLAAKQLKKHSWRFHKKYTTWFQRHEAPKVATEEYEEGTYVYFDYESGWCQRFKSEFKFEYAYLEDELSGALDD